MVEPTTIAAISAGGDFLSGAGAFGSLFGGRGLSERKQMALQAQYNREVMQNQLQWRAADAEKAGISKVFAMGAPATSFAPSSNFNGGNIFDNMSAMGQGINRAVDAYSGRKERAILFEQERKMNDLKIKNAEISNALAASDLATRRTGSTVPINSNGSLLIEGQGDVSRVPSEITASRRPGIHTEAAGPAPAVKEFVNRDGTVSIWPSKDAKNSIEDSVYEWEHMYRNRFIPWASDWIARKFYR